MTILQTTDRTGPAPACDCPTSRTPGTVVDRIDTHHRPSCPVRRDLGLGAADTMSTTRWTTGTLDQRLDAAFGPVTR